MCCQNKCTDTWARKRIPQGGLRLHDWKWWRHSWWHQICWHLVALAVSLDGNGIKFGLGDNGNLSVEVDAKIYNWWHFLVTNSHIGDKNKNLLSGHNNFWGLNTDLGHFVFSNLIILIFWFQIQCFIVYFCWVIFNNLLWKVLIKPQSTILLLQIIIFNRSLTAMNRFYLC